MLVELDSKKDDSFMVVDQSRFGKERPIVFLFIGKNSHPIYPKHRVLKERHEVSTLLK